MHLEITSQEHAESIYKTKSLHTAMTVFSLKKIGLEEENVTL